jgi:hypothetical protein
MEKQRGTVCFFRFTFRKYDLIGLKTGILAPDFENLPQRIVFICYEFNLKKENNIGP